MAFERVPLIYIGFFAYYVWSASSDGNGKINNNNNYYSSLSRTRDFYRLATDFSELYVDKSLLIARLLQDERKVVVITRPNGWGVTVNMNMLERFFDPELDDRGRISDKRVNRKLFAGSGGSTIGGVRIIPALKIAGSDYRTLFNEYQGTYPVINLNLRDIANVSADHKQLVVGMKRLVTELFHKRIYIRERLDESYRNRFDEYLSGRFDEGKLNTSLEFLAVCLKRYFGKPVIVLISHYETPIVNMLTQLKRLYERNPGSNLTNAEWLAYRKAIESDDFRKSLASLSWFITNSFRRPPPIGSNNNTNGSGETIIEKVLMTGAFLMVATGWHFPSSRQENITSHYCLLDEPYSEFYGFTREEVRRILSRVRFPTNFTTVTDWYGGYRYNNETEEGLYRPLSVTDYIANKAVVIDEYAYRIPAYDNFTLERPILLYDDMQTDIQQWADRKRLSKRVKRIIEFDFAYAEFVSLLAHYGYFSLLKDHRYYPHGSERLLLVPNRERQNQLKAIVTGWLCDRLSNNVTVNDLTVTAERLAAFDVRYFNDRLKSYVQLIPNDIVLPKKDKYYAAIFKSILYRMEANYTVRLEEEMQMYFTGSYTVLTCKRGRCDNAIALKYHTTLNIGRMLNDSLALLADLRNETQHADNLHRDGPHVNRLLSLMIVIWNRDAIVQYAMEDFKPRPITTTTTVVAASTTEDLFADVNR